MIIGVSGRWRVAQLIQSGLIAPEHPESSSDIDYFVLCFIPALKALLKQHDEVMQNDVSSTGLTIGYRAALYSMDTAFNINALREQVSADGAGGDLALGAFLAFRNCGVEIEAAMGSALDIASQHNLTVDPPFYVEKL